MLHLLNEYYKENKINFLWESVAILLTATVCTMIEFSILHAIIGKEEFPHYLAVFTAMSGLANVMAGYYLMLIWSPRKQEVKKKFHYVLFACWLFIFQMALTHLDHNLVIPSNEVYTSLVLAPICSILMTMLTYIKRESYSPPDQKKEIESDVDFQEWDDKDGEKYLEETVWEFAVQQEFSQDVQRLNEQFAKIKHMEKEIGIEEFHRIKKTVKVLHTTFSLYERMKKLDKEQAILAKKLVVRAIEAADRTVCEQLKKETESIVKEMEKQISLLEQS